jgi:hypothetical protein
VLLQISTTTLSAIKAASATVAFSSMLLQHNVPAAIIVTAIPVTNGGTAALIVNS